MKQRILILLLGLGLSQCSKPPGTTAVVVSAIASAADSACAIVNGEVQCWGGNSFGGLGDGTIIDAARPVKVKGLTGPVTHLTGGTAFYCTQAEGGIYCWGYNAYGALGTGDRGTDHEIPTKVQGTFTNLKQISIGGLKVCTLSDEGVQCWGINDYRQVTDTADLVLDTPVAVSFPGTPSRIVSGAYVTCAIIDGAVYCYGKNSGGELGRGNITPKETVPGLVTGLTSGVVDVQCMALACCALLDSGTVKCWGDNEYGTLGNNSTTDSNVPVEVSRITSGVTAISGNTYAMTAVVNGELFTWGRNRHQQLGAGVEAETSSSIPIGVVGAVGPFEQLICSSSLTCYLSQNKVYCLGRNDTGSLGNGKRLVDSPLPVEVSAWVP